MIKLVAVDLDDTLLNNDIKISEENKKAIQECRKKGVYFTFATGRMFRAAVNYAKEVDLDLPLITYQGALIKTIDEKEIQHHVIEKNIAADVIEFLRGYKLQLNVYMNDNLYVEEMNDFGNNYVSLSRVEHKITNFPQGLVTNPTKILLAGEPSTLDIIQKEASMIFGNKLTITKSKDYFLEFGNEKAKKSIALKALAENLGIKREEILAIGDGMNDLDMLEYAGTGVAMENAAPQAKEVADYITDTNDNHGVAKAINKFVL